MINEDVRRIWITKTGRRSRVSGVDCPIRERESREIEGQVTVTDNSDGLESSGLERGSDTELLEFNWQHTNVSGQEANAR